MKSFCGPQTVVSASTLNLHVPVPSEQHIADISIAKSLPIQYIPVLRSLTHVQMKMAKSKEDAAGYQINIQQRVKAVELIYLCCARRYNGFSWLCL